ncbi:MAG: hypothetical protein K6E94_03425 [Elusimicrobiaceae bacterium]|nr:hypothetical protein [Elusimicrobiaceae bacterium]
MKYRNIIALCLGIFVAVLLWQYYLWPKYQIKTENPDTLALLDEAAQRELEESINSSEPGEILFVGDKIQEPSMENSLTNNLLVEDMVFYSQANKPKDILDLISNEDIKKHTGVHLDNNDFVVSPNAVNQGQEDSAIQTPVSEETPEDIQNDTSRITMIKLPEEFVIIKDKDLYNKFLQEHEGNYPKIDFTKQTFIAVVSAGRMADNFFEIIKTEKDGDVIQVFYRVNLMGVDENRALNNYRVIDTPNSDIKFTQVK